MFDESKTKSPDAVLIVVPAVNPSVILFALMLLVTLSCPDVESNVRAEDVAPLLEPFLNTTWLADPKLKLADVDDEVAFPLNAPASCWG